MCDVYGCVSCLTVLPECFVCVLMSPFIESVCSEEKKRKEKKTRKITTTTRRIKKKKKKKKKQKKNNNIVMAVWFCRSYSLVFAEIEW